MLNFPFPQGHLQGCNAVGMISRTSRPSQRTNICFVTLRHFAEPLPLWPSLSLVCHTRTAWARGPLGADPVNLVSLLETSLT